MFSMRLFILLNRIRWSSKKISLAEPPFLSTPHPALSASILDVRDSQQTRACFIYTSVASSRFVSPALIAGLIRAASGFC